MSDTIIISMVVALCGLVNAGLVFATFWLQRGKAEGETSSALTNALREAAQSTLIAAKALAHSEALASEVAEWRVEMADKIGRVRAITEMQGTGLTAAENRLSKSIDDMGSRFDSLSSRFDRFFESHAGRGA